MKTNYRKAIKFTVLLLTSLLIGLASVAAYTEMFMHGTSITIGTAGVKFVNGTDTVTMGGADAINAPQTEVTFDVIPSIEPGETRTYNEAVNITNGAGAAKTVNVSLYSISGDFSTDFDYINITVFDGTGTPQGSSIQIVSGAGSNVTSTGNLNMAIGAEWTVRWIIKAKTGATDGNSFDITLKMKVE